MTGWIFDIKEMAVHDGPGLRTTVFFKGCPLRCRWCHNPEGLSGAPQLMFKASRCRNCGLCRRPCSHEECKPFERCIRICPENCLEITGREITPRSLAREIAASAQILGKNFGGVTFSGGEPLAQPAFLLATEAKLKAYHLCVETSGYASETVFLQMLSHTDFVIMDMKLADRKAHRQYTGVYNDPILRNLRLLQESGKPHLLRTPLIPGITDTEENLEAIRCLAGASEWECLPYNPMAGAKYPMLGMEYTL